MSAIDRGWPEAGDGTCCFGAAVYGPGYCTCWEPVYDLDQAEPDTTATPGVMPRRCSDCAYLRKSPERADEYTAEWLDRIAATGERFWCHDGLRRPTSWRHPSGVTIPGDPADYQPPIIDGVPYRADGRPGDLCAGWMARALKASWEVDR